MARPRLKKILDKDLKIVLFDGMKMVEMSHKLWHSDAAKKSAANIVFVSDGLFAGYPLDVVLAVRDKSCTPKGIIDAEPENKEIHWIESDYSLMKKKKRK